MDNNNPIAFQRAISDNGKPFMDNGNPISFQRVNLR